MYEFDLDGDGINVYVSIGHPLESSIVPEDVFLAAIEICKARARRNFGKANDLCQKTRQVGYRLINHENKRILACKYRFRLKGIDAPENDMPYGKEAKEKLIKLVHGKQLMILVYDMDRYGCYGFGHHQILTSHGIRGGTDEKDDSVAFPPGDPARMVKGVPFGGNKRSGVRGRVSPAEALYG
ncbi:Uncharacterized protein TCM_018584 [Theobroma cacao]|uniref:TNase-like domain-containing protein n=1 Tax=Theobroma cacao TaxID=3641 RepID=A0A061EMD8_THECC|nr:Uncharacterized protein TCM_018584 [Theobroma cacao]